MKQMSRKQVIKYSENSQIREFILSGYPQKVLIDGFKKSNPVVICLHGGPGTPIPFSVGCRGMFPGITGDFTLVCWDQLGCGINNYPITDSFAIVDFVQMTIDLIKEIRQIFPDNKIFLFGMSWGSILALLASRQAGELIDGVCTYGQVLCNMVFNEEVFDALERSPMPEKKKQELHRIREWAKRERPMTDDGRKIMTWLRKYTEAYLCKSGEKEPMAGMIFKLLTGPDYRLRDFKAVLINGYAKNTTLMEELTQLDLRNDLAAIDCPYTIIQGSHDMVTSTKAIRKFLDQVPNAHIRLVEVEKSGHFPGKTAMDVVLEEWKKLNGQG